MPSWSGFDTTGRDRFTDHTSRGSTIAPVEGIGGRLTVGRARGIRAIIGDGSCLTAT